MQCAACVLSPCRLPAAAARPLPPTALPPTPSPALPPPPPGCGCPYTWAPGCRLCDWGDSWLQQAHASLLPKPGAPMQLAPIRPLKVAFCIPHHNVTGGLKMLLEQVGLLPAACEGPPCCWCCAIACGQRQRCQHRGTAATPLPLPRPPPLLPLPCSQMRLLRQRGHHVVALTRSETAHTAVPPWSDAQASPLPCRPRAAPARCCLLSSTRTCAAAAKRPADAGCGPRAPPCAARCRRTRAWCAGRTSASGMCTMWIPAT